MSKCGLNRCCVDWMTVQKHMLSKTSLSLIIDDLLKILEVQDFRNDWLHSVRNYSIENYAFTHRMQIILQSVLQFFDRPL